MQWVTAHRTSPKVGERESGDAVLVRREGDAALLAVIDGLGHGKLAAQAAAAATESLARWPFGEDLEAAMRGVHEALRGTRGAAAGVCVVRPGSLVCCGVGNVEIRCIGAKVPILLSPGVLGARVQSFRICRAALPADVRMVLFSDGISYRAQLDSLRQLDPESLCDALMRDYRKNDDDASVLVCDSKA
mgnify:CR=1 FL=1